MPTISDYLQAVSGSFLAPQAGKWVRLVNNVTTTAYVSTAATDATGLFTVNNVPAGLYTVYQGPTATGAWTATGDGAYEVAPTNLKLFNVLDFNAKGDGTTDDTTAIAAAITAAASTWGTVYFPPGTYKFTSQLVAQNVRLLGAGQGATILNCPTALGSGVPAIILSSTKTGADKRSASASGFLLNGPGSYALGVKNATCDGIRVDNALLLSDLAVRYFDSGIVLNSAPGHVTLLGVTAANNYYGVYQVNEAGDYALDDCDLTGNNWASIAVPGTPTAANQGGWQGNTITRTHLGFSPYGIYQETGSTATTFIYNSSFYDCRFEAIGNCALFTEQYATSVKGQFNGNHFFMPAGTLDNTYKIAARPQDYFAKVGYVGSTNYFVFGNAPWPSGSTSWLYVNENYGVWYIVSGPPPTPAPTVAGGHSDFFTYFTQDRVTLAGLVATFNGLVQTPASAAGGVGLNLPHGAAPTSPVNGDIWTTTAGMFVRINGVTKTVTLT